MLTFGINISCFYSWTRSSFLLVDVFCIALIISFGSYKFISFDIFISLFTILLRSNSLTIFIHVFCYYFCSWSFWCEFPFSYKVFVFTIDCCIFFVVAFECPCSFSCFYFFLYRFCWYDLCAIFFTCLVSWF